MGAMPESWAATAISQAVSIDIAPCSRSRNSQSKPAAFITLMMSTLRTSRTPMPIASSFFLSRALAALIACAMLPPPDRLCGRLDAMTFHVERIDHVVLRVRDPAAMVRFYEQALGFKVERRLERIEPRADACRRLAARPGRRGAGRRVAPQHGSSLLPRSSRSTVTRSPRAWRRSGYRSAKPSSATARKATGRRSISTIRREIRSS